MVAERPLNAMCMGLAFAKDGRTLVTSTSSGTGGQLTLWGMPEGTKLASYPSQQDRNPGVGTCFAATADLSLAAYGSGRKVCVIDLRSGKELWEAVASKEAVIALAFSPDGKTLACAAGFVGDSDIRLWDAAKGKETGRSGRPQLLCDLLGVLAGWQKTGIQQHRPDHSHLGCGESKVRGRAAGSSSGSVAASLVAR